MNHFYDLFDNDSYSCDESTDYLSAEGRTHYDYNGCLPSDDDAADHYRSIQRASNVIL